jgi:SAM-dependent methyltransferase
MRPDEVIAVLALRPDDWIADVGCGPGLFALRMAKLVPAGAVFAVDIEPAQLDRLREGVAAERLENVVPVLASPGSPHLPRGRFDWLFMADTYHHLANRVEYMRELRAALAPGGKLAMFEYKPGDLPVGPPADHKLPPGQMERELEASGWVMETDVASHKYHDFQIWTPRAE